MGVTIILPAHNEEKIIKQAIESLLNQSYWDTEIIVCLDNCTDQTESILNNNFGDNYAVKIFKSVKNEKKKAGALNQLFNCYFKNMRKYILVMDADTILHHKAIEEGVRYLKKNEQHGVVCSKAGVIKEHGFIWNIQNIEYGRFDTDRTETLDFCIVAHGMFSMYRKKVLSKILQRGYLYDEDCITEDYELTLAVKQTGYKIGNSLRIKAYTDVPLTVKDYWVQRVRWMTGGLNALSKYSFNKHTARDMLGHVLFVILFTLQFFLIINSIINKYNPLGFGLVIILGISTINAIVRYKYVSHKSLKTFIFAVILIPDIFISWFQTTVMINAYARHFLKIETKW